MTTSGLPMLILYKMLSFSYLNFWVLFALIITIVMVIAVIANMNSLRFMSVSKVV